jgi:hypothetical protein
MAVPGEFIMPLTRTTAWRLSLVAVIATACILRGAWHFGGYANVVEESPQVAVLVATKHVPYCRLLENPKEYFRLQKVLADSVPEGALFRFDQARNWYLTKELQKGEVITAKHFDGFARQPESALTKIRVELDEYWNPWPGYHCDVIWLLPKGDKVCKKVVAKNVLLIVQDNVVSPGKRSINESIYTVLVKNEELPQVSLAKKRGTIRLIVSKTTE